MIEQKKKKEDNSINVYNFCKIHNFLKGSHCYDSSWEPKILGAPVHLNVEPT